MYKISQSVAGFPDIAYPRNSYYDPGVEVDGILAYWRDSGFTADEADLISAWRAYGDEYAVQSDAAKKPLLITGTRARCNGTDEVLTTELILPDEGYFAIAFKVIALPASGTDCLAGAQNAADERAYFSLTSSGTLSAVIGSLGTNALGIATALVAGQSYVAGLSYTLAGVAKMRRGGAVVDTDTYNTGGASIANIPIYLGARNFAGTADMHANIEICGAFVGGEAGGYSDADCNLVDAALAALLV